MTITCVGRGWLTTGHEDNHCEVRSASASSQTWASWVERFRRYRPVQASLGRVGLQGKSDSASARMGTPFVPGRSSHHLEVTGEGGWAASRPLFFSRKSAPNGARRPISRQQAWEIVRAASERADVRVLALRSSAYGKPGEPAPVYPHLFRHARVRQIVRTT